MNRYLLRIGKDYCSLRLNPISNRCRGSSTLHFVGEVQRLHPDAFRFASLTGFGTDWPLTYAELEPIYAEVEKVIGVAGTDDTADRWRSTPYPMLAHPISPGGQALKQAEPGCTVNPRAVNSVHYDERPSCNYCGHYARDCPLATRSAEAIQT